MSKKKVFILVIILAIIALGSTLGYKIWLDQKEKNKEEIANVIPDEIVIENKVEEPIIEEKKIEIYNGEDRPIAVMIDNHSGAWPQAGLNKTYLVYEMIAEGGETRLMALFKGQDLEMIGPIRSSRHYFLDYALENDAIYVHYGWSPQAQKDISRLSVNNINGIFYDKPNFWRIKTKFAPHHAVTSTEQILEMSKKLKYRTTSEQESVLNYVTDEVTLEDGIDATNINIPHSYLQTVQYKYDEETKRYTKYARKKWQTDYSTVENITTKNIIIEFIDNSRLEDGTNKDRQDLSTIGTFDGYYITNGKAIKIECTKNSRKEQTIYKDLEGNIINVNDGNTWINICPKNAKVVIE